MKICGFGSWTQISKQLNLQKRFMTTAIVPKQKIATNMRSEMNIHDIKSCKSLVFRKLNRVMSGGLS